MESPAHSPDRDWYPVGEGPDYEAIRQAARDLVPLFSSWDNPRPSWSLGNLGAVEPSEDGRHRFWIFSRKQRGLGTELTIDLNQLRASAICLLAYCEAQERRDA